MRFATDRLRLPGSILELTRSKQKIASVLALTSNEDCVGCRHGSINDLTLTMTIFGSKMSELVRRMLIEWNQGYCDCSTGGRGTTGLGSTISCDQACSTTDDGVTERTRVTNWRPTGLKRNRHCQHRISYNRSVIDNDRTVTDRSCYLKAKSVRSDYYYSLLYSIGLTTINLITVSCV
jgi:hypothetical protein